MRLGQLIGLVSGLLAVVFAAGACKDNINLGEVRAVAELGQDWDGDGTIEPLPAGADGADHLIDFGQVVVLQQATRVVALRNGDQARDDLRWNSIELVDAESSDFFLDPPQANDLAPGEAAYFAVHYVPSTDGADSGELLVTTNDPDRKQITIALAGEGVSPDVEVCLVGPDGELCNDPQQPGALSLDFGMNDLGDSTDHSFVVRNTGVFELTVGAGAGQAGVDFGANTSQEFILSPEPWTGTLAPGAEQSFVITYSPIDGGADAGRLEVHSNDPDEPLVRIDLLGNGLAPKICPQPPFLVDFGSIQIGSSSNESYTFSSCGNQVLVIEELALDSGNHGYFSFATAVETPFDLSPGETFAVELTYAPATEGAHAGQLDIYSNDPNAGEGYIELVGQATPVPTCDVHVFPTAVDFGTVSTSGFANQTVAISNSGDADCDISEIRGPTGSAEFSFPTVPFTGAIPPGEMRQFTVRYQPADEGADTGSVTVVCANDPDEGETEVSLSGSGVQPPPCDLQVDPALLNFGSVPVGGRVELSTTIYNFGSEECYVTNADLTQGSDPSFIPSPLPFPRPELGPGDSVELVVAVEPLHGGVLSGELVIKGAESNPFMGVPMATVQLSAGGQAAEMCLHPTVLDYGPVPVGDYRDLTFEIQACGPGNLRVRQIAFEGANPDFTFASVPGAPRTIPAGTSHTVTVRYSPSAQGADFGRVLIAGNGEDDPSGVIELVGNYSGNCPSVFDCQPDALWFEATEIGRSREQAFICTNHGSEPLEVLTVELTPGTSPEYLLSAPGVPRTVAPDEQLHVEVAYIPADVGADTGAVAISSQFSSDECDNFTLINVPLEAEGVTADLPPCIGPQNFEPELLFEWPNGDISNPQFHQVFMSPIVINLTDDNGDGFINENDIPDIVFNSFDYFHEPAVPATPAMLRAISGDDGHEIWTIDDPHFRTNNETQVAAADIDGDNLPEILASKYVVTDSGEMTGRFVTGTILCFEHDGTFKWESEPWHAPEDDIEDGSAIGVADLDHDGHPEIFRGPSVFNHRGELLWEGEAGRGSVWHGVFCTAADLDMAGEMELVCGNTAYRHDGSIYWQVDKPDGLASVADFDVDGYPEVFLFASGFGGGSFILDGRTGQVLGSLSGSSNVNASLVAVLADLDDSGGPEIGVVGRCPDPNDPQEDTNCFWGIDVTEANFAMNVIWEEALNDTTLGGGNSAFDFEGDGTFEMLQNDENYVNVYRGLAHDLIYQAERWSVTGWENPLVVDVNNDNHAEIIVVENGLGSSKGILVYGNAGPVKWVETKRVWNQYDYHITNIRENGTVPRFEVPNWTVYNNFLANEPFCE